MKKLLMAVAAVVCLAATASAQAPGGPVQGVVQAGGCVGCGSSRPDFDRIPVGMRCKECDPRYGAAPFLRNLLFWQKGGNTACKGCGGTGIRGGNCAGMPYPGRGGAPAFNPYPDGVPGTLVFPQNPYIRSPRDWFMTEK